MGSHTLNALTVKAIAASKSVKLRDGGGLWLVTKGNGRYWILDYRFGGKRREMGIGPLHTVGLGEARQRAEAARALLRRGIDPIAHRAVEAIEAAKVAAGVMTFGKYADAYIDAAVKAGRWRGAKTEAGWRNTLTNHVKLMRDKALADIDIQDVLAAVRPLWGTKQETAEKLRWRIERVLDAAKVEGLRSGDNPAAWKGNMEHVLHKPDESTRGHHEALPYKAAPAFLERLRGTDTITARALELLILTATRSAETRLAVWDEFDLDAATWTLPEERTKERRELRVPLCERAVEIVKAMKAQSLNHFVFPGVRANRPISDMTFGKVIGAHGGGDATTHGFRSTFKDWAAEQTEHENYVSEAALGHAAGDAVERAYRRGDALEKRRKLMEQWAAYCGG
ncbi:integrase arm-type DNA-binding domain-containing protein [Bradyrhizobium barranii subsp. barranii]|uniref:Integrase arm-type DNA-binding domain-containing protein n=1 Tax=Bradyrhizobium barranii subsp. barranii TaxID=2823807 RepID=A0A939M7L7_9BRAD|nr:site-specific integrase [Bradyrhizobium barranii]UEM08318.1 integrase arm-type DNA-binding domain-containing protein [Bradyrhizobium barranii subsp. barranii]